jgi:hypothetical protein
MMPYIIPKLSLLKPFKLKKCYYILKRLSQRQRDLWGPKLHGFKWIIEKGSSATDFKTN